MKLNQLNQSAIVTLRSSVEGSSSTSGSSSALDSDKDEDEEESTISDSSASASDSSSTTFFGESLQFKRPLFGARDSKSKVQEDDDPPSKDKFKKLWKDFECDLGLKIKKIDIGDCIIDRSCKIKETKSELDSEGSPPDSHVIEMEE